MIAKKNNHPVLYKVDNIGALRIRIGFWGPLYYTIFIIRNPQNYEGPFILIAASLAEAFLEHRRVCLRRSPIEGLRVPRVDFSAKGLGFRGLGFRGLGFREFRV